MCLKQIPYICLDCPKFFPGVHLEPKSVPYRLSLINDTVCIYLKCLKYCRQDVDHSGEDSGHRERDGADAEEQGHRRPPRHAQGEARQTQVGHTNR